MTEIEKTVVAEGGLIASDNLHVWWRCLCGKEGKKMRGSFFTLEKLADREAKKLAAHRKRSGSCPAEVEVEASLVRDLNDQSHWVEHKNKEGYAFRGLAITREAPPWEDNDDSTWTLQRGPVEDFPEGQRDCVDMLNSHLPIMFSRLQDAVSWLNWKIDDCAQSETVLVSAEALVSQIRTRLGEDLTEEERTRLIDFLDLARGEVAARG